MPPWNTPGGGVKTLNRMDLPSPRQPLSCAVKKLLGSYSSANSNRFSGLTIYCFSYYPLVFQYKSQILLSFSNKYRLLTTLTDTIVFKTSIRNGFTHLIHTFLQSSENISKYYNNVNGMFYNKHYYHTKENTISYLSGLP